MFSTQVATVAGDVYTALALALALCTHAAECIIIICTMATRMFLLAGDHNFRRRLSELVFLG